MKIIKFGHSCLLIEEGDLKILMDPGNFCAVPEVSNLDVILITHEHDDHCFLPAIQEILKMNPQAEIITHTTVGKKLAAANISSTKISDGAVIARKNISISSHGREHARIHKDIPIIANTGYFIAKRLFYPGDSFFNPHIPIEILALPVAAPWMRMEESIEYAKEVKPKIVFPVHDGMLRPEYRGSSRTLPEKLLAPCGIVFVDAVEGSALEL